MKLAIPHMIEYCKQKTNKQQQQPKTIGYVILLNKLFWNDEIWCMKRQFDRKDSSCGSVNVKVESDWIIGACLSLLHTFNLYLQALLLRCRWSLKLKEVWPWLMDCKRFSLCTHYHREPVLMWIFMLSMKTTFVIIWASYITFFARSMKGVKVFYFESSICTNHFDLDCGSVCLGTWRLAKSVSFSECLVTQMDSTPVSLNVAGISGACSALKPQCVQCSSTWTNSPPTPDSGWSGPPSLSSFQACRQENTAHDGLVVISNHTFKKRFIQAQHVIFNGVRL